MSQVLLNHPEPWIGIPESFPNDGWQRVEEWADDLVEELAEGFGSPVDDQFAALAAALVEVANSRVSRGATRIYATVDSWTGPLFIADLVLAGAGAEDAFTLEELVGSDDPDAIRTPAVEEFVTDSGLVGVVVTRYVELPDVDGVIARVDYAWRVGNGFVRLYTAQIDFVHFDAMAPRLAELARSLSVTA